MTSLTGCAPGTPTVVIHLLLAATIVTQNHTPLLITGAKPGKDWSKISQTEFLLVVHIKSLLVLAYGDLFKGLRRS